MKIIFDSKNLINKYGDMIYRVALGYVKNKEDAEDIVQEVFIKYIEQLKAGKYFNDDSHEKFWLIRVTINLCCNHLKRKKIHNRAMTANPLYYELDEQENVLLECMDKLSEKYKIVFELFYLRDLKISEISKILNISEANVKTRLKRAREKIIEMMKLGAD